NLSEWANFRSSPSTSGWSGRGGLTRNPYALDRNPSGSSSGSAVAVSASLSAVAVGTETDGSIVSPSSACGIVGIKPTVGLVSRAGIIPISHTQDTAGPMARTVADAAILLGALAGVDPEDPATARSAGKAHPDYSSFLDPEGLRGARVGVARRFFRRGSIPDRILDGAIAEMRRRGAVVVDPAEIPTHGRMGEGEHEVLLYEFKAGLNAYLSALGPKAPVHSLQEVIEFNLRHRDREMPYTGQETLLRAQEKGPLTEPAYLEALRLSGRLAREEGIDAVMGEHRLDVLVAPTAGPAPKTDLVYGDRGAGGSSGPAAIAGYPSITVPAGEAFGLPVGLSFFGPAWSEPELLRIAFAFEQASRARRVPTCPPTVG
ncbi:MAG TPA: amidase, partial [Planctomycetota bacterium]|nr:amidase [Planctomycetota bacterium]